MTLTGLLYPITFPNSKDPVATRTIKKCWHMDSSASFIILLNDVDMDNQSAIAVPYSEAVTLIANQDELKKLPSRE